MNIKKKAAIAAFLLDDVFLTQVIEIKDINQKKG
jgi:hypothetical protein